MTALAIIAVLALVAVLQVSVLESSPVVAQHLPTIDQLSKNNEKLRANCTGEGSTETLNALRREMVKANLSAYIVPSGDDHQSEFVSNHDKRREYVSGFTGSAGTAVVTLTSAALWTDSRYYLQAEEQLDCNWDLIKTTPSIPDWLIANLQPEDIISTDSRIVTYFEWKTWSKALVAADMKLEDVDENLVDIIWRDNGQPPYPTDPLFVLEVEYAGETWQEKIARVRNAITTKGDVLIVSALDEIAWVLNLRGADIPYSPLFRAYLVIGRSYSRLYVPPEKVSPKVVEHLAGEGGSGDSVSINNYLEIWEDLPAIGAAETKIVLPDSYSYAGGASYRIYSLLPASKVVFAVSPILSMKDSKNDVEAQGLKNAHIRDAVALCMFFGRLEREVIGGVSWSELSASNLLAENRRKQDLSIGLSFETISAFGPNAALPHYVPIPETDLRLNNSSMYMVDSGGQYLDGTTDVTRTIHFGTPTRFQQEVYTRLLMGCINLCSVKFPAGKEMKELEILLRAPLYELGLDYGHGSTHGIGAFGGVHEAFNTTYHEHFFGSQEPGYYRDHEFGMRLENIVTVVEANLPESGNKTFLTFEPVTLVPYYRKLIVGELMTPNQLIWLNEYHSKVFQIVGEEMKRQGYSEQSEYYKWLEENTKPI